MSTILSEVEELVRSSEAIVAEKEKMLKMFELAGYDLNIEFEDGKGRPKDLIELLKEALGNPPEDAGKWIRISDIPRFVKDNLVIPDDLKSWNDANDVVAAPASLEEDFVGKPVAGKWYEDVRGNRWKKESEDSWTLEGDHDIGGFKDIDALEWGPLKEIIKTNTNTSVEGGRRVTRL